MKNLKNLLFLSASIVLIGIACSKSGTNSQTSGNWVSRFQMSGWPRGGAAAFVIGDTGYVATGFNSSNDTSLSDLWQMSLDSKNPSSINWTQKAFFPGHARHGGVGFAIGTKGYVATGIDDLKTKYQDCYQYNPATNTWTQKASLPDNGNGTGSGARYNAVAFTIGNYGYVGTGNNGSWLKDFWKYDPSTDTWTAITNLPGNKREGAVVFTDPLDTAAYLVTGGNNNSVGNINDFWRYSPTAGWQRLRDIANTSSDNYDDDYTDIVRQYAVAFIMPNAGVWKAYLTTGVNGSITSKTWEYDFKNDLWTRKTPYERSARENAVAWSFINLKRGFVGTGQSGTTSLDDIDEWFPADTYEQAD